MNLLFKLLFAIDNSQYTSDSKPLKVNEFSKMYLLIPFVVKYFDSNLSEKVQLRSVERSKQ